VSKRRILRQKKRVSTVLNVSNIFNACHQISRTTKKGRTKQLSCEDKKMTKSDFFVSSSGAAVDPEHEQEGRRGVEDDLRHVGEGRGKALHSEGPANVDAGSRRPLAVLGHPGVLARRTQLHPVRAAVSGDYNEM
jgi:hypothetical protein